MKIKQAVIYRLKDVRNSLLTFYLVVLACFVFFKIVGSLESVHMSQMNGLEMATIMFLFVLGLFSFRSTFYLFIQNGVSRKTMFYSYIITMLAVSGFMALIDTLAYNLNSSKRGINSLFEQLYSTQYDDELVVKILVAFVWSLSAYLAFSIIGYFVSTIFYRMNKTLKIIVSVSVPCLLFIALPIVDSYYDGKVTRWISNTFDFFFGTGEQLNPFISVLTCCGISIILGICSYALVKKAVIKRI
jgi:peptidoglycan/LPS O-acetylase OafA/YrhL